MINLQQLSTLFSVILLLDRHGRIHYASDTFRRHLPDSPEQAELLALMELVRPATVTHWEEVDQHLGSLFMFRDRRERFAMRGQLLAVEGHDGCSHGFFGAPWLTWLNENRPDVHLGVNDFTPQDSQLDQLFLMTIEKRMVGELEELNEDLRQAKRETELAQEAKSAFFARMSHEMRTPLNGVISALSLLAEHELPESSEEILRLAQSSSRNLMKVINYVLDLSKIESGETSESSCIVFRLSELLEGVTDIVRAAAIEKGLELRWSKDSALRDVYFGDKPKLRQCLLNLVTNAIRFTDAGRITVRALESPIASSIGRVRLEVEDTGIGITAEERKRIFQPFWTKARGSNRGTGLGLDIVRRSIELMDGTVGVASAPGAGSLFWLDLPLEPGEESTLPPRSTGSVSDIADCFSGRVLLVDDNETNLVLGSKLLETMCVTVDQARSGAEALARCGERHYDLVFMDISMPGMDGVSTTVQLRERFDSRELPVVALTAYASALEEQRCLEAGMNHYLTKPVVKADLALQLSRFLPHETAENCAGSCAGPSAPSVDAAGTASADTGLETAGDRHSDEGPARVNVDTLSTLQRQIGAGGLEMVIGSFLEESRLRLQQLTDALQNGDLGSAQREAHTLASTCASIGMDEAAAYLREAEATLLAGQRPAVATSERADALISAGLEALTQTLATLTAENPP